MLVLEAACSRRHEEVAHNLLRAGGGCSLAPFTDPRRVAAESPNVTLPYFTNHVLQVVFKCNSYGLCSTRLVGIILDLRKTQ
jgi:hypothetical protein